MSSTNSTVKRWRRAGISAFWLSILLHLLLLLSFSVAIVWSPTRVEPEEKSPAIYIPSYVYQSETPSPNAPMPVQPTSAMVKQEIKLPEQQKDEYILNPVKPKFARANALAPSLQPKTATKPQREDPVHMIGDKLLDDPLKKLLGQAITRHLIYPRIAQQLRLRGVVAIGFIIHRDGTLSNVMIKKSSRQNILDIAALTAVKEASPVSNVEAYLQADKPLVINIIFK